MPRARASGQEPGEKKRAVDAKGGRHLPPQMTPRGGTASVVTLTLVPGLARVRDRRNPVTRTGTRPAPDRVAGATAAPLEPSTRGGTEGSPRASGLGFFCVAREGAIPSRGGPARKAARLNGGWRGWRNERPRNRDERVAGARGSDRGGSMASGVRSGGRHARGKGTGRHGRGLGRRSPVPLGGGDGARRGLALRSHAHSDGVARVAWRHMEKTRTDAWLLAMDRVVSGPREGCAMSGLCLYHSRSSDARAAERS